MNWKNLLTNPFKKKEAQPEPEKVEVMPVGVPPADFAQAIPDPEAEARVMSDIQTYLKDHKPSREGKLNEAQQIELMELIARFATVEQINEHFMTHYKLMISQNLMYQYKKSPKWKPVIKKLREKYIGSVEEVAGTHKRVRMERREEVYHKAIKKGRLGEALKAVKDQEEEIEGPKGGSSLNLTLNQYNSMTDEEIEERKRELIEKLKVIDIKKEGS